MALAVSLAASAAPGAPALAQACVKADFEAVVDEAAAALRDMNLKNKPTFQEKLRQLKEKRGWAHDLFLKEAAPFVRDATIAEHEARSEALLERITAMGQEGSSAKTPDCKLHEELHGLMRALVEIQTAKWIYMFAKIDKELAR